MELIGGLCLHFFNMLNKIYFHIFFLLSQIHKWKMDFERNSTCPERMAIGFQFYKKLHKKKLFSLRLHVCTSLRAPSSCKWHLAFMSEIIGHFLLLFLIFQNFFLHFSIIRIKKKKEISSPDTCICFSAELMLLANFLISEMSIIKGISGRKRAWMIWIHRHGTFFILSRQESIEKDLHNNILFG